MSSKYFKVTNVVETLNQLTDPEIDSVVFQLKQGVDTIAAQRSLTAALTRSNLGADSKVKMKKSYVVVESKVIDVIVVSLVENNLD